VVLRQDRDTTQRLLPHSELGQNWVLFCDEAFRAAANSTTTKLRCLAFLISNATLPCSSGLLTVPCFLQCHRRTEEGVDVVFPVNAVAYNPLFGTFATGGGDGMVNIWDGNNKKRLFQVCFCLCSGSWRCFSLCVIVGGLC
jgi:WD40 repeat protein